MTSLIRRHLLLFFRDRTALFFSFLAVFIILGLYVLFLGDVMVRNLEVAGGVVLMNSWVMAGILAITPVTASLGALGVMVEDRSSNRWKDLQAAPVKRSELAGGYLIGAMLIAFLMSILVLILAEVYLVASGGKALSPYAFVQMIGIILLTVMSACAMLFWIASFLQSQNAFSTISTIIGTLIGFLTGIYIPIGSLPDAVQSVIKWFPISHAAALARQVMTEDAMSVSFADAPPDAVRQFKLDFGILYQIGDSPVSPSMSILFLAITGLAFFGLSLLRFKRKRQQ